jgi:hypothetical protein
MICVLHQILGVIKSRVTTLAGHVARMGKIKIAFIIVVRKLDHLIDLSVDGRIILII